MAIFDDILAFWFHGITDATPINKNKPPANQWFVKNSRFNDEIRQRFEADWHKARAGELKDWGGSPRGTLALVILFDQFPRNMFRNSSQAFATDVLALDLASRSIREGADQKLALIERVFLYMPFMHAEDLKAQEEGVRCFQNLIEESKNKSPHNTHYFEYNLSFARRHRDIIAQFGRFPHRNAALKREPTPEESDFLKKPRSSF